MMGNYHVRFGGRERRVLIEARPSRPNAELGSAFLCASLGIVPTVRHSDYIGAWLEVLREDNRAIFRAASMASKAADWLLARHEAAHPAAGPSRQYPPQNRQGAPKVSPGGARVAGMDPASSERFDAHTGRAVQ